MATNEQRGNHSAQPNRSENLLPAGDDDDGRFDVAEEVSLDQQSDAARSIGQAPANPAPDVPGASTPAGGDDTAGQAGSTQH
jgi:hypothetical protein